MNFWGLENFGVRVSGLGVEFLPVRLSTLSARKALEFDLYQEVGGEPRLFKSKSFPFLSLDIKMLERRGCEVLYIPLAQKDSVIASLSDNLPAILKDESIEISVKFDIMTQISESILGDIMTNPSSRQAVGQCRHHVTFASMGEKERQSMAEKQPEAPFPVTHALVVSNYSILLGLQCGIDSADEIHALGVGGLLHEIGKTIIDSEFYTRLDNKSFIPNARLKSYPKVGGELLKKMKVVPAPALRPVLEHQERLDGSGYPLSLQADGIGLMGRIVAICDAYHEALHPMGDRPGPTPYKVLRQMRRETTKFDGAILVKFIRMLGGQFCN